MAEHIYILQIKKNGIWKNFNSSENLKILLAEKLGKDQENRIIFVKTKISTKKASCC